MRINTIGKNKIFFVFFCVCFFWSSKTIYAQCPTIPNPTQTFCDSEDPTVSNLAATPNGNGLAWYASASSTIPLTATLPLLNGSVYYADDISGTCGSRQSVTVTIYSAPVGSPFQGACVDLSNSATIANLTAVGNNVRWYNVPVGGTPLLSTTVLSDNTIYYASQTNPITGCETKRLLVFVNVGFVPAPTGNASQVFCNDPDNPPTVADLQASGNNNWYLNDTTVIPLALTDLLINGHSYFATTVDPPCESSARFQTVVTLANPNVPGDNGNKLLCSSELASSSPLNLFDELGGTPDATGVWTGPFSTINGHLGTLNLSTLPVTGGSYVFTYTVSASLLCPVRTSTVTITINKAADAGINGTLVLCSNNNPQDLFASLGGNPQTGGVWSPILASGTGVFNPAVDLAGVYTYTITGILPCIDDTATITVSIIPEPKAGVGSSLALCSNSTPQNLFPLLGNTAQLGGTWSPPLASGTGVFNPAVDVAGTYTYTVVGTLPCLNATASVVVTITPKPVAGVNGNLVICSNGTPRDLFPILGNTAQTGGTWSPVLASGSGIFNPAVDSAGIYTYTVAGVLPCVAATATVNVAIIPEPKAGVSGSLAICINSVPQNLFSALGNTAQSGGTWSPALASGTGVFNPAVDGAGIYTYTVVGTAPCANATATVTVSISPEPNAGNNGSLAICVNDDPIDLFSILGSAAQTGGAWSPALASGTGVFNPAVDTAALYTYTVIGIAPCINDTATVNVVIIPKPIAGINGVLTLCSNGNAQNLFPILGNTAQLGGTWSPPLASGTGFFNPAVDSAGIYTYTVTGTVPCANATATVTVTITPKPIAGVSGNLPICSNGTPQDLFLVLGNTAQTGGTWSPALASGTGIFNPVVDLATVYTYTVFGTAPCLSSSATVNVSIIPKPIAGVSNVLTLCSNANSQNLFLMLGATAQTGGTWSPPLASGTGFFNPAVDPAGIYTYTVTGIAPCLNDSASATITIIPKPNAGISNLVSLCSNISPTDLFLSLGGTPQTGGIWSPPLASGTGFFNPAIDSAGAYTYTISGTSPCIDASAIVTVTLTVGPEAGVSTNAPFCVNSTPQDLFPLLGSTAQTGGTWSPALASGTGIFNPAVDTAGNYTYLFSGPQICDNDTATVSVTINPIPDAGTDGIKAFCSNDAPQDLFASLQGTPQTGGVWSPALASGTGIFNPLIDLANTYTYSVGGGLCSIDTATIAVSILQAPNAGGIGATLLINSCFTNPSVNLFTALNGTQGVGAWSDNDNSGALSNNIFNPSLAGAGTYHFTYTVNGTSPCGNDAATVTVIVSPAANAGTFTGIQNVCNSANTLNLFTLLNGNQAGGIWTNSNNQIITNMVDVSTLVPNTYSFNYTINNSCGTDSETVQFTILSSPVLILPNVSVSTLICKGDNAIVSFSGMTDGSYTINYNLTGNNTVTNQTANFTITAGVGNFTINSATIPNSGTTTVTFVNIANTSSTCSTAVANVSASFIIRPSSNLEDSNLSILNVCLGSSATVLITNAIGLPNGNYQFNYTIPQASPATGSSGIVAVSGGSGQFVIPSTFLTNASDFTLIISAITSLSSGCNTLNENATASFKVLPIPNAAGATLNAGTTCINFSNEVFITGANSLANGTYTVNYQLTGANTATASVVVPFTGGNGSFIIPASNLINFGNVTVTINQINSNATLCGTNGNSFVPISFAVAQLGTPTIVTDGNEFCATDYPTIANLSSNILGTETVTWYTASTGGVAYATTDLLQNGVTYYATFSTSSGCQSPTRLSVKVDLTRCINFLIPDGFSPNGDTVNDEFVIRNLLDLYPNFKLEIYNRYGNQVYSGTKNTPNWDGTSNEGGVKLGDKVLSVGVYFYILEFNDGIQKPKQGRIYLSR